MGKKSKQKQRQSQSLKRSYAGASVGRLTQDWIALSTSADAEIWTSLRLLRNRSRSLCRDNDYAVGAVRTILSNVLGETGIKLQSKIPQMRGDKLNDNLNRQVEKLWNRWGCAEYCDVSGRLGWMEIERLVLRSVIESGEVLIRLVSQPFANSPVPLALQVIESDHLADEYSLPFNPTTGNIVKMGIEMDLWDRPVAYWIYPRHPGDNWQYRTNQSNQRPERIPADEILHIYLCDRPGQSRGVPWLATAINRLRHMGGYEEAEIIAARAQACSMGFITTPNPEFIGADDGAGNKLVTFEPGTIQTLQPGEQFQGFAPTRPNAGLDPFLRFMLRAMSAGIGVGYEEVAHDYSQTSYSSQRASMLEARGYWRVIQRWLAQRLHQPVFKAFLSASVISRGVSLPGFEGNEHFYGQPLWMPRGWTWIDPSKDVAASTTAITSGLSTLGRDLAEQGIDLEELIQERKREVELLKSAGISVEVYPETMPQPKGAEKAEKPSEQTALAEGLTSIRLWDGIRAAKKCKAKPCGNTCIASSKACLHGLSPAQKKLAQAAGKAMKKGKTGAAVDLPESEAEKTSTAKPKAVTKKSKAAAEPAKSSATIAEIEKAKLDPILHDFYDHVKGKGKLTKQEELLAYEELGADSLDSYQKTKVEKLKKSNLTDLESAAVENYIGQGYQEMNMAIYAPLDFQEEWNPKAWQAQMAVNKAAANGLKKIEKVTDKDILDLVEKHGGDYKSGDPLVRSITLDDPGVLKSFLEKHKVAQDGDGKILVEQFMSTTFAQEGLDYFESGSNVTIKVKAKLDGKGSGVLVDKYKNKAFESEVLYPPMTSFKVLEIKTIAAKPGKVIDKEILEYSKKYESFKEAKHIVATAKMMSKYTGGSISGQIDSSGQAKAKLQAILPKGMKLSEINKKDGFKKLSDHLEKTIAIEAKKVKIKIIQEVTNAQPEHHFITYEEI